MPKKCLAHRYYRNILFIILVGVSGKSIIFIVCCLLKFLSHVMLSHKRHVLAFIILFAVLSEMLENFSLHLIY